MIQHTGDTIVAVSSAPGRGLRSLVRVSGPGVKGIIKRFLSFEDTLNERCLTRARFGVKSQSSNPSTIQLPVLIWYAPGPGTFTSEDTLEIQLVGNSVLVERLVDALIRGDQEHGVRLAEAGEFTHRAFAAGRIDLTRAEGIAATIGALSDAQLHAAKMLRCGQLGQWAESMVDTLGLSLALVEAGIDFVDQEDVVPILPHELDERLKSIQTQLEQMLSRSRSWASVESIPWVVMVGQPNAGKSTLFNALLGHTRAVVSDVAGTTRDILAEPLRLQKNSDEVVEVMLVDVAGFESGEGVIDQQMQLAVQRAMDRAELILHVSENHEDALERTDIPVIQVRTKIDQPDAKIAAAALNTDRMVGISALTGAGLEALRNHIIDAIGKRAVSLNAELMVLQPRHRGEMEAALVCIGETREMLSSQLEESMLYDMELVALVMRRGLDHLGALGGVMTPDDVIGKVFATFCVGK